MPTHDPERKPQQERSRQTLARLLAATIQVLDKSGLDGATIPRIARAAGVSPATVYRRFKDKQALLRETFLHMLERINQGNREHLAEELTHVSLRQAAHRLIGLFFAQYREHPHLLRALERSLESDDDPTFVNMAQALIEDNLGLVVQAMLTYRKEIAHADPERAVRIATLTASTAVQTIAFKPRSVWHTLQPTTDETLADELARGYVAYLKSGA